MVNETLIKVTAFSIVILLLLYYLDIWGKRRKRNKVRSYFFKHGYIPVNETDLKFKNFENNIIFDVSTPRIEIYHIKAIIPHDQVFEFEIIPIGTRRYGSDNSYKETVKYLRELDISTTNAIHIQYIFSNQILDRLESFFKMDRWFNRPYFLDVKSNDGLLEVHVEIIKSEDRLYSSIEFIQFLIIQLSIVDLNETEVFEEYKCFNCNAKISFVGYLCTNCGLVAPKCIICFVDPEPNENIIMFNCCKTYAHKDHALTWIGTNKNCPSCRNDNPKIKTIKEATDTVVS